MNIFKKKFKMTTHNYICGQMSKYKSLYLKYSLNDSSVNFGKIFRCERGVNTFTVFQCLILLHHCTLLKSIIVTKLCDVYS